MGFRAKFKKAPDERKSQEKTTALILKGVEFVSKLGKDQVRDMRKKVIQSIADGTKKSCRDIRAKGEEIASLDKQYEAFAESKYWPRIFELLDISEDEAKQIIKENM